SSLDDLGIAVAKWRERRDIFDQLKKLADRSKASYQALVEAEELLARKEASFPGLKDSDDAKSHLEAIIAAHRERAKFQPDTTHKPVRSGREEDEPGLIFDPLIAGTSGPASADTPVVLALVRGVLYGLDRGDGQTRWAHRVGVDTTA